MAPGIEVRALNKDQAAAYLGVHITTVAKYIKKGILSPFYLPNVNPHGTRPMARIKIEDLDRFVYAEGVGTQKNLFNPWTIHELPVPLVARLLGISDDGVWMALGNGALKDRSPETIRKYQIRQLSRKAGGWVRRVIGRQVHGVKGLEAYLNE